MASDPARHGINRAERKGWKGLLGASRAMKGGTGRGTHGNTGCCAGCLYSARIGIPRLSAPVIAPLFERPMIAGAYRCPWHNWPSVTAAIT